MDEYWKQAWQSIPDDRFAPSAEAYLLLNIWQGPDQSTSRFERSSINKESLLTWARVSTQTPGDNSSRLVFQCLIVSTHDYNDFPVDISRDVLSSIAEALGVARAHVPLLFTPYTGYAALDRQLSWYYGLPGLRALASTDTGRNLTRAIVSVSNFTQPAFVENLSRFSCFAAHPMMLALTVRATAIAECEKQMQANIASLRQVENLTGFHAGYSEETASKSDSEAESETNSSEPPSIDLARLSKKVGSDAANLGNFKILVARLGSMKKILLADNRLKWQEHFDPRLLQLYRQWSDEIMETDLIFEAMRGGLLEAMAEYQNRARSLQTVIFNLIAKEDANASIDLAKESRAIAVATRNDGTSMKTIAIMTMIFLPATFYAALFAVPTLQWQQSPVIQTEFWIYWAFTVPSTVIVLLTWYFIVTRQVKKEKMSGKYDSSYNNMGNYSESRGVGSAFEPMSVTHQSFQNIGLRVLPKRMRDLVKPVPSTDGTEIDIRQRSMA